MLEKLENEQAQRIVGLDVPSYRQAYSDRMAWLMAYMAELAYLKYDAPSADGELAVELLTRALKRTKHGSVDKVIAAVRRRYDYDHDEARRELSESLDQIGWALLDTFSTNATQGFVAYGDLFAALAFRGTEADRIGDIKADAKAVQTTCPTGGRVHSGFKDQYDDVASRVEQLLDRDEVKGKPLFIAGHSLGGAVATIAARRLTADHRVAACYTYGSPRVGTEHWVGQIKTPIYRVVNSADPVPMVPLSGTATFWLAKALRAVGRLVPWVGAALVWFGDWIERTMSCYAHAGNMRFLTNSKDGDLSQVELLYTVGWGRRFRGALTGIRPAAKVLGDHGIALYRRKMMSVAQRRNP
ncbi:MAG: lipase family protein [Gammaproteobacteria bacterium]|nr:lipase family protein [Gammaproteobacteria bacterium]